MKYAFGTLLQREYWENRGSLLIAPLVTGGFMVFMLLLFISGTAIFVAEVDGEEFLLSKAVAQIQKTSPEELTGVINAQLMAIASLIGMVWFVVTFFYLLGSLYDDRKDRSILFWKSLPVSDTHTVLSKLAIAVVISPLMAIAAIFVTWLVVMMIGSVVFLFSDVSPWAYLWGPAKFFTLGGWLLSAYAFLGIWLLPIWGWLLLASAWARSKPFLWAIVPPGLFALLQSWFNISKYFNWRDNWLGEFLAGRLLGGLSPLFLSLPRREGGFTFGIQVEEEELESGRLGMLFEGLTQRVDDTTTWVGFAFGIALVAAAIYIRRYRDDG